MQKAAELVVRPVDDSASLKEFIEYPKIVYRNDAHWVPPIWLAERAAYRPGGNSVLDRSPHVFLAAYLAGRIVGRLVAYIDPNFNEHFNAKTGFFGSFECGAVVGDGIKVDASAACALLAAAEAWLSERGMDRVRGPINPVAECWGFLVDGFGSPPIYMSPYNPPYYDRFMSVAGYTGIKDLLAYEADVLKGYEIPKRFGHFDATVSKRKPSITTRMIDPRRLNRDAEYIRGILNAGVDGKWGFVPVGSGEMAGIVRDLKPILNPAAIWFVEDGGVPVGCCLGFPDVNVIIRKIRGRLFPTGALRMLFGARHLRDYRLWGLAVLPEYQGLGLDVLLYLRLAEALSPRGVRMEANYVLEDNLKMRNALEKLGMKVIKKYRVYEKDLS